MKTITKIKLKEKTFKPITVNNCYTLKQAIIGSWSKIAPFWPLKNLIGVNPVAGFENLDFEEALKQSQAYFQQQDIPKGMLRVNRESIKWLQAFFDEGQATIQMPNRHLGLLKSTLSLIRFDKKIHKNDLQKKQWIEKLPHKPETIITETLLYLGIQAREQEQFLTLMLTTLPGWASYIQYHTKWASNQSIVHLHPVTQSEYLAFRLVLSCLVWPKAKELLSWHKKALKNSDVTAIYSEITAKETSYQKYLINLFNNFSPQKESKRAKAQIVFCIDVRSEPFRRSLEAQGEYETYGFAGFFGVPVLIENAINSDIYASCPVLLKPDHQILEHPDCALNLCQAGHRRLQNIKKIYQSMKYTFATPFNLVEIMGFASGIWMSMKNLFPSVSSAIQSIFKRTMHSDYALKPDIQAIPFDKQVDYGISVLKIMGLTENFAPLVIFCGHGSTTENNAYASALDCGACGGRHGASNARILAAILNSKNVRDAIKKHGIEIPQDTLFLAAKHNTTTDEVEIYSDKNLESYAPYIESLKVDLNRAREENSLWRCLTMGVKKNAKQAKKATAHRAKDWAQVRPEWGLARNASFIVGPRWLTKGIDLEGRAFLHSYEWAKDYDGSSLKTILTAPMVVAQWINAQYFFSTIDNIAFGGGSKITQNITGKIGIMQGNASDLMHGLSLQSVFKSDDEQYHQPMRLTTVIYAPKSLIDPIIKQHKSLQKLFGNNWINLICFDPNLNKKFNLQRDLTWNRLS